MDASLPPGSSAYRTDPGDTWQEASVRGRPWQTGHVAGDVAGLDAPHGDVARSGHVAPMSVRRAEGEASVTLSYCVFTPLIIPDPGRSPLPTPLPLPMSMLGKLNRATRAWTPPPRSRPPVGRPSF